MTCGGCAASVRGDLTKVDGISDVKCDIDNATCTFGVTDESLDVDSVLDGLAKTNDHIAGFKIK